MGNQPSPAPPAPFSQIRTSHTPRTPETPLAILHPSPGLSTDRRPDDFQTALAESSSRLSPSMILPNFLYLGSELTLPEHVQELKSLGSKRILNIAAECDNDRGLNLRENFGARYTRIPMRETVEEDKITKGLKEACQI